MLFILFIHHFWIWKYGDSVDNAVEEHLLPNPNALVAISKGMCCAGSKTLQQQNPPVRNWKWRLTQVDLYNGCCCCCCLGSEKIVRVGEKEEPVCRCKGESLAEWLRTGKTAHWTRPQVVRAVYIFRVPHVIMPSVLWRCWLGGRKGIRPVKNWVVGCWRGYLSGARCRLVYGPAGTTGTHCILLQ